MKNSRRAFISVFFVFCAPFRSLIRFQRELFAVGERFSPAKLPMMRSALGAVLVSDAVFAFAGAVRFFHIPAGTPGELDELSGRLC